MIRLPAPGEPAGTSIWLPTEEAMPSGVSGMLRVVLFVSSCPNSFML